jgi:hypothetical protein
MKEKLLGILKDAKIEDSAAKQIAEGVMEAMEAHLKTLNEAREKEENEAVELIRVKVADLKDKAAKSHKALYEAKEDFKKRFEEARTGVKKLIEEDYKAHKAELSQKTKLFVESKWKEIENLVKEQVEKETKANVKPISEAKVETKVETKIIKDETEIKKLNESIALKDKSIKTLTDENATLKTKVAELEKVSKTPLKEQVNESKIGKILPTGEDKKETVDGFLGEIVRLAYHNSKVQ